MGLNTKKEVKDLIEECFYEVSELPEYNRYSRAKNIALLCVNKQIEILKSINTEDCWECEEELLKMKELIQKICISDKT